MRQCGTHLLEDGHLKLRARLDMTVIGVSSVTGGHQAGEQGEAAWAAGWRGDVGVVESHALGGKKIHGGRPHVLRSVNGSI